MPGVSIDQVQGLVDPLKQYQFLMNISPIRGQNIVGNDVFSLRCSATQRPGMQIPQVPVELAGFELMYAGRATFQHQWTTTLIEGQDMGVILQIASWMKLIYDKDTGTGSYKSDYSALATIEFYDDPGDVTNTMTIEGIWPTVDPGIMNLNFASTNGRVDYTIVWSYDKWDDSSLDS